MARILFVTEKYPPDIGGLARSGERIALALGALGHQVEIFCLTGELDAGRAQCTAVNEQVTLHRFGRSKATDFTLQESLIFFEWLHQGRDDRPIDLVWSHYAFHNGFMGIWFARHFQIPSILAVRGNDVDRQIFPPGDLSRLLWSLQNATQVIAVSADLQRKVRTLSSIECLVIPNSVDTEVFQPGEPPAGLRERYGLLDEDLVLLFSGELRAKKGQNHLLRCVATMAERRPTKLLILGDIRPEEQGVFQRLCSQFGFAPENVRVTGNLPDLQNVAEHLRLADLFLLPSLWDGLPNSLIEAMASGLPVLCSDAGAIPEVVTNEVTGTLVPRSNLHQLAEHVEQWLSRPGAERKKITERARARVLEQHSKAIEKERLHELVSRVSKMTSHADSPD